MVSNRRMTAFAVGFVVCVTAAAGRADTLTQWEVPFAESQPFKIMVAGPDVFYLDGGFEQHLGRLDPAKGKFTQWTLPFPATSPGEIVRRDSDGAIFVTGAVLGEIAQFNAATQVLRRWRLPFVEPGEGPFSVAVDDQGRVLFETVDVANLRLMIGRLDTATGAVAVWPVSPDIADTQVGPIIALPDGTVFFNSVSSVAVLDPASGVFTSWAPSSQPAWALASDGAGSLYFQEQSSTFTGIARLIPGTGRLTEWATPGAFDDDLTFASGKLLFGSIEPTGLAALDPLQPGTETVLAAMSSEPVVPLSGVATVSSATLSGKRGHGRVFRNEVVPSSAGAFTSWAVANGVRAVGAGQGAVYFTEGAAAIGRITP
jgi:streptogramin lyase